jgi:hypothetical protein
VIAANSTTATVSGSLAQSASHCILKKLGPEALDGAASEAAGVGVVVSDVAGFFFSGGEGGRKRLQPTPPRLQSAPRTQPVAAVHH